jgi:hypothetical protein
LALAELHKFLSDLCETHFVEPCRQLVIETLFTLADEEMKMLSGNTNQAMQMTLRVVSGLLNSIDMVFGFDKFLKVMKAVMLELRDVQGVIAREAIYMGYAIWLVSLSNHRNQ